MKIKIILFVLCLIPVLFIAAGHAHADRPRVMLTGYWNPTGQMIADFCTDPLLNPGGWKGENWEGMGVDVYSFFPEPGTYTGWFQVDYQDTWNDFWKLTDSLRPVAILSFGAARPSTWEIEYNARNLSTSPAWINDYKIPRQPSPRPPDSTVAVNYTRRATIPAQRIADAVNSETDVRAYIDWTGNPGRFLCEYMAYLVMWYQSLHSAPGDPHHCQMAGFIHVGDSAISYAQAKNAAIVSIREMIRSLSIQSAELAVMQNQHALFLKTYTAAPGNTVLSLVLPASQNVTIRLLDVTGAVAATIYNGQMSRGAHRLALTHPGIASGVYICRVETAHSGMISGKTTILR